MRILAVDDQPMTLTAISSKLESNGYDLILASNGEEAIAKLDTEQFDLVIVDLNMPKMGGLGVIKHMRAVIKSQIPIMVMSGENAEHTIVEAFELGADEYIQKPVGLNELLIRVQKLLGQPIGSKSTSTNIITSPKIQKNIVGVVIPCYNEEKRLQTEAFEKFVNNNLGYHLCFVNDGSKDNTLEVLNKLANGREDYISVYNCEQNGGKAEAVRQGTLHMIKDPQLDYIGYLDADLSTNFQDFDDLVNTISGSDFQIVGGSRISRMGADITKAGSRAIISKTINLIIRKILGMSFQDTQCGAKVMTREVAEELFQEKFLTSWLFDVEIFMRMKHYYGADKAEKLICEQPLKRWIHEDGSNLSMMDSFKILGQLVQIAVSYRGNKNNNYVETKNLEPATINLSHLS